MPQRTAPRAPATPVWSSLAKLLARPAGEAWAAEVETALRAWPGIAAVELGPASEAPADPQAPGSQTGVSFAGPDGGPWRLAVSGEGATALSPALPLLGAALGLAADLGRQRRVGEADRRALELLGRAFQALHDAPGPSELAQQMTQAVHELLQVEHVALGIISGRWLLRRETAGPGAWDEMYSLDQGIAGRVGRTGQPALVPDVSLDPDYEAVHPGTVSEICVPLLAGERVVGVLNVESETRRLTEHDLGPLLVLGRWLGGVLDRERLYADTERQRVALELLHRLRSDFDQADGVQGTVRAVTQGLRGAFGYQHVSVYFLEEGGGGPELVMQHQIGYIEFIERLAVSRGVMGRVARTGQAQWIENLDHDPEALKAMAGITSEVCVPLRRRGEVIGVLNVETTQGQPALGAWDARLIGSVAGYLEQALERHWLRAEVEERDAQYRILAEHTSDLVCLHGPGGRLLYVSPSVEALLGHRPEELIGRHPARLLHPDELSQLPKAAHHTTPLRWRARHKQGYDVWLETQVTHIGSGGRGKYLSSSRDITARHLAETRLAWAATHDALTGLANRERLLSAIQEAQVRARVSGRADYAVLYLDLDRFKVVNDSLGHHAGDALLQAFAARLLHCTRSGDLVARLGGDEFAVLFTGLDGGVERAEQIAARLNAALAEPFTLGGRRVQVSASIGIAPGQLYHQGPDEALRDADLSMYQAKLDPHRRVCTFDPRLHAQAVRRLTLESDLPHAAARGQLRVVYQPVVRLRDGGLCALEALLRWDHPELGAVSPAEFIPLAEELELIADVGEYVLREACRTVQQGDAPDAGETRPVKLNVNLSPRQFLRSDLVETVRTILEDTGLSPRRLNLEVTESALVVEVEEAARILAELRALGVSIHIDDFGTGHSSLAFLHRFPVEALKIDRAFTSRLSDDPVSVNVVQTVLALGRALGAEVIAEGIETPEQRAHLLWLGCGYGQGYLYSPPVESVAALALLEAERRRRAEAGREGWPCPGD